VGLYCSLNLGVSGLISDEGSLKNLRANHSIGDIISVEIEEEYHIHFANGHCSNCDYSFDDMVVGTQCNSKRPLIKLILPRKEVIVSPMSSF
jgi:hypothetical protein